MEPKKHTDKLTAQPGCVNCFWQSP